MAPPGSLIPQPLLCRDFLANELEEKNTEITRNEIAVLLTRREAWLVSNHRRLMFRISRLAVQAVEIAHPVVVDDNHSCRKA